MGTLCDEIRRISTLLRASLILFCIVARFDASCGELELQAFAHWFGEVHQDWNDRDVDTVVQGITSSLEDHAEVLGVEGQALLLEATYEWAQRQFPDNWDPVPADYLLAAVVYRSRVEAYVEREPLSEADQARLSDQLDEIGALAVALWAASPVSDVASAGTMMDDIWKSYDWERQSPLGLQLKSPFSDEEFSSIINAMTDAAQYGVQLQGLEPHRREARAGRFVSGLLDPLIEIDDTRRVRPSEEVMALLQQSGREVYDREQEKLRKLREADVAKRAKESDREQFEQRLLVELGSAALKAEEGAVARVLPEPNSEILANNAAEEVALDAAVPRQARVSWGIVVTVGAAMILSFGVGFAVRTMRR